MRDHLELFLNGRKVRVSGTDAFRTAANWLREVRGATGTKTVCEEGDCGACTVLVGTPRDGRLDYVPVNSCIQMLFQLDGIHVVSVEGLQLGSELSDVQRSMVDHHGAQCGYCTPGFVVAMTALRESGAAVTGREAREALTGNLCRCTGYDPIIEAALDMTGGHGRSLDELYPPGPIAEALARASDGVRIDANGRTFFAPHTLRDALAFLAANPGAVIVQGGTDFGVQCNKRGLRPSVMMTLAHLDGLDGIAIENGALVVGGRATLAALEKFTETRVPALHGILQLFGSPQIRNAGTLAGNVANASPIADTLPFLFVCEAELELESVRGKRAVGINAFYKGYKQLDKAPDEMITKVRVPLPGEAETVRLYKVSKRRDLDISTFTAAIRMTVAGGRMSGVKIAYGGVAPVVLRLPRTEALLEGAGATEALFREAGDVARGEIAPISDVRGSKEFRSLLAANVLMKFFHEEIAGARVAPGTGAR
ncbi:MAG: FAD binding domain-containing protein [Acidobacteria bacterium]|nr:FAD binding domain-containing protein [Acidobacteriota bacterium]